MIQARIIGRTIVSCAVNEDTPQLVQLFTRDEFCRYHRRRIVGLAAAVSDHRLDDERAWVIHRRMSGNILYRTPADPPDDYTRAVFVLDDEHELHGLICASWDDVAGRRRRW